MKALAAAAAVVLSASVALIAQRPADDNAFPRTKPYGRATVQYEDPQVKAVAIYDYSQRNHNQPWLLVQFGVALSQRTEIRRENFHIVQMPDRREVPLATQQQFLDDAARIQQFKQNARIFYRNLTSFFPKSGDRVFNMRWVALPGEGTIPELVVIPAEYDLVVGDLYFRSPTLRWPSGVHRLVFDHPKGHAELPIRLE
jgi:hypothetical protein